MKNYSTNFGQAKKEYVKYRPEYPIALFDYILKPVPRSYQKAIDLGAGTGISTKVLSNYFERVYAVEPDVAMIKDIEFDENVSVFNCSAEEFDCINGTIDLITAGNSFYWMNGEQVIKKVAHWLKEGGVFAAYRYDFPNPSRPIYDMIQKELIANWNQFRSTRLIDTEYTLRTIADSGLFSSVQTIMIDNVKQLTAEELVGFFASTSYGSAYLQTLDNQSDYVEGLTKSIKEVSNEETIGVDFGVELVLAIK